MVVLLSWLLLHPAEALPGRVVGRLLVVSVKAGLQPDQVETVFGRPDWLESFTSGPIGSAMTTLTYAYRRYGVTVHFLLSERHPAKERCLGERIRGGIE
jgi:hypothetical protein